MTSPRKLLSGMLLGAGAMYLLDPDRGARRRSILRDKGVHASRLLATGLGTTARDVRNRSAGAAAAVGSRLRRDAAGDQIVQERVRTALGRVVSHPSAVKTAVYDGRVFLSGPILQSEIQDCSRPSRASEASARWRTSSRSTRAPPGCRGCKARASRAAVGRCGGMKSGLRRPGSWLEYWAGRPCCGDCERGECSAVSWRRPARACSPARPPISPPGASSAWARSRTCRCRRRSRSPRRSSGCGPCGATSRTSRAS